MKKLLLILTTMTAISASADAKWWIFGKSNDEVGLKYLYVNNISADETGPKIKLFRETLASDGLIKISGKASAGRSAVGAVRLTLDDKASWTDIKFADNGAFEYSFRPETGKTYAMLLEVTDTAGKTNKVEDTRKELSLSGENIQAGVRGTLDAMFDAYSRENLGKFMGYVGDDFAGDKDILERAVKRDFDALSSINLRYTINNIAAGAQGRVFVSVTYNRMVFVNKTGASNTDAGATEFVFDSKDGRLSLFSMKQPLMFGLSDAENVATGTVLGGGADILVLDDAGTIGGAGTRVAISCPAAFPAYKFATGEKSCGLGSGPDIWFYAGGTSIGYYNHPTQVKEFLKPLSSLTAPEVKNLTGYSSGGSIPASTGNSYCFDISSDFYCVEPLSMPAAGGTQEAAFLVKKF
ncbi:MAG: hypothetical protein WCW52_02560 [Elusimicrobiales bacterium]|jgi:hypothetical protein